MKKVLLTALALLMGTFMYAQQNRVKIPGAAPSKDVKTEAVLSAVKAPANTNSARTTKGDSELTYCTADFNGSIGTGGTGSYYEWAAVFRPSMYTADDNYITSVEFYSYQAATYTVSIYEGEAAAAVPTAVIYQHQYDVTGASQWVTLPIVNSVVAIDKTKALWVAVGTDQVGYPASYSNEVLTTTDCCMMYFQSEWLPVTDLGSFEIMPWMIVANTTSDEPAVTCDVISTFPYFNDFENFLNEKDCWISIDNDGDGQDWITGTTQSGLYNGYNASTGLVSKSYDYNGSSVSYDADNYLLSPEFELPAGYLVTLSWYAWSTYAPSYPDHYEVMIAPNGSTDISDFVSVVSEDGPASWAQRTADISAYAGTTVRVVFHHQDYDNYWIVIDNLGIETAFDCSGYGFPFAESFENGLDCWGNIDADGDGHLWELAAGQTGNGVKSVSWQSGSSKGSFDPDNWLISPEITIPATAGQDGTVQLSWYVQSGSTSYREHYGVYVSTTGDQPDDFTTQVYEGQSPNTAGWTQLTVDLNAYIGQTIRVAFRHYDSYDNWHFVIDDVEVYEYVEPAPVVCDPITTFPYFNDFENFLDEKDCWIDIDNDGDGYGWFTGTETWWDYGFGVDGSHCLVSESYQNATYTSLNADNYLLSPEFELPAGSTVTLSWYEQSQDASYPDSYEVMIAPNGSTEISDFVSIYSGEAAYPWTERTADLSAYAGTTVRVVFHHESYDCYMLEIDNMSITVEGGDDPSGELTIYADATDTQRFTPVYTYYGDTQGSAAQFVAPASLLTDMVGKQITSMKFYANPAQHYNIQNISGPTYTGYMTEVESETMSQFIDFNSATNIFNGNIALTDDCLIIDLATPYTYNGGNLAIAFSCTTSAGYCSVYYYSAAVDGGSIYRNGVTSNTVVQNYIPKTTFTYISPEPTDLAVTPTDLGVRPNGAWMEPVTVEVGGGVYNVTAMEMENDYFTFEGTEVPFTTPASFAVTTGDAAATGLVEGTLSFMYNNSKTVKQFTMTATAYDPVEGDVVETAIEVANPVGYTHTPEGVYHNYNLPGEASDGADAVYKLTFASDVMLDANVGAAENGKVALYAEDFNGEAGPMATNNYEYNGPQVEPGAGDTFTEGFESGLNGWTSLDADGDGYGWKLASTMLSSGYGHNGSADLVLSQSYDNAYGVLHPNNYLVSPQKYAICGTSVFSIWACGQDASYCAEHFSIEVSEAGASAADFVTVAEWTIGQRTAKGDDKVRGGSRAQSTWKQYTADLSAYAGKSVWIAIRHFNCSDEFYLDVDDIELSTGSKGEIARGGSSTLTYDFENGTLQGWTAMDADGDGNNWYATSIYGANGGSYAVASESYNDYAGALSPDNYLVSPQVTLGAGASISFYEKACWGYSEPLYVLVSTTGTNPSDFTLVQEWSGLYNESFEQKTVDLSAYAGQQVYIAFRHANSNDNYAIVVDDITINGVAGDEPEPGAGMFVPAGTYYLVAQATESFTTSINATAAPAPEQAVIINPTDGMTNVEAPVAARWKLGNYTTEMQVLVGSQYPPQNVLIDWTSNLTNSATINDLLPNTTYFMQVNERNDSGVTMGEIVGFTTVLDAPAVLEVATSYLYPGDAAMLSWEMNRSFRGYNVYVDEMKVNEAIITESEYAVEGLEYGPHTLNVTAVYDEGESAYSNDIEVEMTGFGHVAGAVFEQDSITPIAGAEVKFIGTDAFGFEQTFTFTSANDGTFTGDVYEGSYIPVVLMDGYQETALNEVNVAYESTVDGLTFIVREFFVAPGMVVAEELENNTVNVYWDWNPATLIEDFEHDGEMPEGWNQVGSYGWEITTNSPYEGTYCIKSSNAGIASSTGAIEMTVDVPYEAKMSFYVKPSSESNYDKFYFYIDGVEKFNTSGAGSWTKKEYTVEAGTHTYKWAYTKDSSVNSNDDCIYVDYVTLYEKTVPTPPVIGGTTYEFENSMDGWTSLDADGDGFGWMLASQLGITSPGHDGSADFVYSQSYDNTYGVLYPDNYLVSPSKLACQAGAQVKLWACGQDANYAAEHFGVAVSTGGATASEFNTIAEWTIGSKGGRAFKSADNKAAVRGTRDQSEWTEYTVDLSAYAGQEVWVAIRHFNVSDQYFLDVDDITLATGGAKMETADNRSFQSYNVYRKNVLTDEMTPIYSTTDTTYIDAQWSTLPAGVYQYGVSATYEGNRGGNRDEATFSFDNDLEGWTVIDNDGDGHVWYHSSEAANHSTAAVTSHSGAGHVMGESYCNATWAALTPDDYMVAPEKYNLNGESQIKFYACAQDVNYPAEHFGVAVSTASNTSAADFTTIAEWTLTAKTGFKGPRATDGSREGTWYEYVVDLSSYAGQEAWIAIRHFNCSDEFLMNIDDVTITYGGATPPAPVGDGESEITWSNTLEKGMVVAVDVTVACNNGQSAEGATVKFTNMVEDLVIEGTADAAGVVSFPEFRSGYYTMEIAKAGYATVTNEVEIFEDKSYNITLNEMIAPAEGLFASATGWVMWDNIGGDIPTPPTPGDGDEFTEGFESGSIPTGWTTIDADGDGNNWTLASELGLTEPGHNNSADFMLSQSYINYVGALTPDNYLVTPKVKITTGSEFSFWACAQDPSYPSEHYGVAISTTTATAGAFTTIAEWTMTAKETVGAGTYMSRDGKGTSGGTWYQKTVDLSSYAGQEVYIAIRHFNCTDCFYLNVDDVELAINSKGSREALHSIVMLDGVIAGQATGNWFQLDTDNLVEGQEYEVSVASVYATGMSEWRTTTFTYYSCDNFKPGVKNLAGEVQGVNDVKLTWTLPGGGGSGDEFSFAFDNDLEGWTNIDADGDGHMWYHSNEAANHSTMAVTSHSGAGHVMGESYCNATWAALTPNDFFVTPQQYNIGASSMLSFWACAQDENYAAEHFGVAISTSGNTSASDFTTIAEWTLTAKTGFKGPRATDGSREGAWYEYTCDLSEYAGQAAWIAIRHFNCSDQFIMCLDDISMSNADKANRDDEYLQYCTEEYSGAVGTGGGQVWWANAYTPAQLADYNGRSITKVGQWVSAPDMYGNIYDGTYNVEVYVGGSTSAPGTLVASASQYITGDDAWHDLELNTPVTIDATQHLWFVFNATGIAYPMCGCDYVGDLNSDILSLDGMVWEHAASGYGLSYTWMIRGLLGGDAPFEGDYLGAMIFRDGELITPEPVKVQQMVDENVAEGEHEYMARLAFGNPEFGVLDPTWYAMSCPVFATVNVEIECTPVNNLAADYEFDAEGTCTVELTWACADATAESFKVYRDGVFIYETTDMMYEDDRTNNPGSYTYGVVAVYEYCESEMVTVDITITDVEENDVVEGIYPNPTTGNLYIKAAAMQQIRVANALGQVMMNETVSGDETMIDMSAFEAGVYMVSVTTENGTTVKRISVVK